MNLQKNPKGFAVVLILYIFNNIYIAGITYLNTVYIFNMTYI